MAKAAFASFFSNRESLPRERSPVPMDWRMPCDRHAVESESRGGGHMAGTLKVQDGRDRESERSWEKVEKNNISSSSMLQH